MKKRENPNLFEVQTRFRLSMFYFFSIQPTMIHFLNIMPEFIRKGSFCYHDFCRFLEFCRSGSSTLYLFILEAEQHEIAVFRRLAVYPKIYPKRFDLRPRFWTNSRILSVCFLPLVFIHWRNKPPETIEISPNLGISKNDGIVPLESDLQAEKATKRLQTNRGTRRRR